MSVKDTPKIHLVFEKRAFCGHEHTWEPIQGFSGRYRCKLCNGMGWRGAVGHYRKAGVIHPYACSEKGCNGAATTRGGYCAPHVKARKK